MTFTGLAILAPYFIDRGKEFNEYFKKIGFLNKNYYKYLIVSPVISIIFSLSGILSPNSELIPAYIIFAFASIFFIFSLLLVVILAMVIISYITKNLYLDNR